MSVHPGTHLDGRYRLTDRLAYGGMGEVWRGNDEVLGRIIAVKILRPELAGDDSFRRRFRAEARTTSGLPHSGIAAVYDYGETRVGANGQSPAPYDDPTAESVAYLVMELVPGEALSATLSREGPLDPDLTMDYVSQAGRALHAAHLHGVIHRDIKPANLMVTPDGRVKVTDFGIARPRDHEPLTATGQVMGTAHYLAPELAKGQDASPLSDVYALGVVAYECLAGHRPFEGDNQVAVALAHLNEQPAPLPPSVPEPLRAIVDSAMAKDPNSRMPDAESFAAALEALRYQMASGEQGFTPSSGVLPGSPAAVGLAAAGLLGGAPRADDTAWAPAPANGYDDGSETVVATAVHQGGPPPDRLLGGPDGGSGYDQYGDYDQYGRSGDQYGRSGGYPPSGGYPAPAPYQDSFGPGTTGIGLGGYQEPEPFYRRREVMVPVAAVAVLLMIVGLGLGLRAVFSGGGTDDATEPASSSSTSESVTSSTTTSSSSSEEEETTTAEAPPAPVVTASPTTTSATTSSTTTSPTTTSSDPDEETSTTTTDPGEEDSTSDSPTTSGHSSSPGDASTTTDPGGAGALGIFQ